MSARLIHFTTVSDPTGNLTPFEWRDVPFTPKRVFILHDVVEGASRGGHAHHVLQELIVAVSGSFDVLTLDEHGPHHWMLNRADRGLYVPPNVWRSLSNFSGNAVALVFASTKYNRKDYIRDKEAFVSSLPVPAEMDEPNVKATQAFDAVLAATGDREAAMAAYLSVWAPYMTTPGFGKEK
jgi:oxalate decarboxylase/phosphoglucose isomerase-like protein (cupin superfamily)